MTPLLELSKTFMNPTGCEIIDKMVLESSIAVNALKNNDMVLVYRMLNEHNKLLQSIASHVTQPQFQEFAIEQIASFNSVITCMNEGKCGFQSFIYFSLSFSKPMKTIIMSLLN